MDNLTHSLIGVAIARTAIAWRARRQPALAAGEGQQSPLLDRLAVLTGVVASNLPDADGILPSVFPHFDSRLIYLTHHRGITHTFFLMLPLAALALGLVRLLTIRSDRGGRELKRAFGFLSGIALVSLLFHFGADGWNDYGVHPFSPFWNRWFYGGFIFIVEPLLWFALLAWVIWSGRTRAGRNTGWVLISAVALLLWSNPMTSHALWPVALVASAWGLGQLFAQKKLRSLKLAWVSVIAVLSVFFAGRVSVHSKLSDGGWTDISTTPAPGNPFCWRVIAVNAGDETYRARIGVLSLWPSVVNPETCYSRGMGEGQAPLQTVNLPERVEATRGAYWTGEFSAPWSELTELTRADCRADRLMGFLRVPYWYTLPNGRTRLGDLRYDRKGGGFTEMDFDGKTYDDCPRWVYPQLDWPVLRNARKS